MSNFPQMENCGDLAAIERGRALHYAFRSGGWLMGEGEAGLISVIVPTFDRSVLLMDLLASLAAQTHDSLDIIIVDDGSTDDTGQRVRHWAAAHAVTIRLLQQGNAGPAAARNYGLQWARGEFIYFIDSDDLIFPDALAKMVAALRDSGRDYCLASIRNADIHGTPLIADFEGIAANPSHNIVRNRWMIHAALYRRFAVRRAGPFGESLGVGEDSEFHWRIAATNGPGHLINQLIGLRRIHDGGHLSVGRTGLNILRQSNEISCHFIGWAAAANVLDAANSRFLLRTIVICTLKIGAFSDWYQFCAVQPAISVLGCHAPRTARAAQLVLTPRSRLYYSAAVAGLDILRWLRNSFTWIRRFFQHLRRTKSG